MYLALSYDHRIIDGKAVSFLKIVKFFGTTKKTFKYLVMENNFDLVVMVVGQEDMFAPRASTRLKTACVDLEVHSGEHVLMGVYLLKVY